MVKQNTSQIYQICPQSAMVILPALPFLDPKRSMASTVFMPSFTLPKTTCLPSTHSVLAEQMKNQELFVLGPAFAMDKILGPVCFRMKYTSSYFSPQMDLPPAPLWRVKSPPCCLWNFVCKQLERDMVQGLAVDSDVEEHNGVDRGQIAREALGWRHLQGLCSSFKSG